MQGYRQDLSPATHPIRGDVPDVAQAMANFDAITYTKGASVLKQLMAYVGEDAFVEGLRSYFRDHAWGNTVLDDLMSAIGAAGGRDLAGWTVAWLDRAGTDVLRLDGSTITATSPDDEDPRPHRIDVGSYAGDRRRPGPRRHHERGDVRHVDRRSTCPTPTCTCSTPPTTPSPRSGPTPPRSGCCSNAPPTFPRRSTGPRRVVTGFQMLLDGELVGRRPLRRACSTC